MLQIVDEALDPIDKALDEGKGVLIHCLAGAHRAGTTGVLLIMAKMKIESKEAIKVAKSLRRIIDPIVSLKTLLDKVDKAVKELNESKFLPESSRWYRE